MWLLPLEWSSECTPVATSVFWRITYKVIILVLGPYSVYDTRRETPTNASIIIPVTIVKSLWVGSSVRAPLWLRAFITSSCIHGCVNAHMYSIHEMFAHVPVHQQSRQWFNQDSRSSVFAPPTTNTLNTSRRTNQV